MVNLSTALIGCPCQVIDTILPIKARMEVDRLNAELQDAQFKLEFAPTSTLEYVDTLTFLEVIQERVSRNKPTQPDDNSRGFIVHWQHCLLVLHQWK